MDVESNELIYNEAQKEDDINIKYNSVIFLHTENHAKKYIEFLKKINWVKDKNIIEQELNNYKDLFLTLKKENLLPTLASFGNFKNNYSIHPFILNEIPKAYLDNIKQTGPFKNDDLSFLKNTFIKSVYAWNWTYFYKNIIEEEDTDKCEENCFAFIEDKWNIKIKLLNWKINKLINIIQSNWNTDFPWSIFRSDNYVLGWTSYAWACAFGRDFMLFDRNLNILIDNYSYTYTICGDETYIKPPDISKENINETLFAMMFFQLENNQKWKYKILWKIPFNNNDLTKIEVYSCESNLSKEYDVTPYILKSFNWTKTEFDYGISNDYDNYCDIPYKFRFYDDKWKYSEVPVEINFK